MAKPVVLVLKPGYCEVTEAGCKADCSITLIKGATNILVDTGLPSDKEFLITALEGQGLKPSDVDVVVGTHGHCDHIGNLNLFPGAMLIVSYDICRGCSFIDNDLGKGGKFTINADIDVIPTPGHTSNDISLVVRNTSRGTVVVSGDLFECREDLEDDSIWRENSDSPELQKKNRLKVLEIADYIIPGHGPEFKVTPGMKSSKKCS